MLNYMGPSVGPNGPIAKQLPPATPGTIPDGVPGIPSTVPPTGPAPKFSAPPASPGPSSAIQGPSAPPPAALAALLHAATGGGAAPEPAPLPEYGTTTQEDGSILLHLKNPDGTLGPVVKVLPPVKRSSQPAQ